MRRLHLQFYLAILSTIAIFLIVTVLFWHLSTPARADPWGVEAAAQLAQVLLPPSDASGDRVQTALDGLRKQLKADLALYDSRGSRIAVSGQVPHLETGDLLSESGWTFTRAGPLWILPLEDGRRVLMRPPHHSHPHGSRVLVVIFALALAFAIGAYPIARRLTGRLARLQLGVEQLGQGNLAARVPVEGRDEVAALARSFNDSAARIEELIKSHKLLLANCSHELRTPLARIRLGIERLASSADPAIRQELTRSIGELDELIGEMLLASRLDTLQSIERTESVDLLALAAEEAAHFECETEGEPVTVLGDASLLRRMVRNLLDNAQRHAGGATLVRVEVDASGNATLIIEDHGQGVREADRDKIFEPFYSSSVAGPSARGAGLGLAIVRQIARAHGGTVSYTTRAGGGSRFVVSLPLTQR
jgi:signal transduction histidine kinase